LYWSKFEFNFSPTFRRTHTMPISSGAKASLDLTPKKKGLDLFSCCIPRDAKAPPLMVRKQISPSDGISPLRLLELTADFVSKHKDQWQIKSFGEYLSTLRPASSLIGVDAADAVHQELERFLADLLPSDPQLCVLSCSHSTTDNVAAELARWFISRFTGDKSNGIPENSLDMGTVPFSFVDLIALANRERKFNCEIGTDRTPIDCLKQGEVGYSPSFVDANSDMIPNPFVVEMHWDKAMTDMETLCGASFEPDDRSLPEPSPTNQQLFPDLYFGWGSEKCTHTRREIIRNRIVSVLLNRLAHNYYNKEQGIDDAFVVKFAGIHITTAQGFLWALLETGHEVEACLRRTRASFGVGLCVKEGDGSWTHVPLSCFLRTGYDTDPSEVTPHVGVMHSAMDLNISGPLVGRNNKCSVHFRMSSAGICGWHSNHHPDLPWLDSTTITGPYPKEMTLQAVRMASLLSVACNAIGTDRPLPCAVYGLFGICNDAAALLDHAIRGPTSVYPLVWTDAYLMNIVKRLEVLKISLFGDRKFEDDLKDIQQLIAATMTIGSDLQASPSNVLDGIERYLSCLPTASVFQVEADSMAIMTHILRTFRQYHEKSKPETDMHPTWGWQSPIKAMRQQSPTSKENPLRFPLREKL
jgi:hypothetical protein